MPKTYSLALLFCFLSASLFSQTIFQKKFLIPDSVYYSAVKTTERADGNFLNMTIYSPPFSPLNQIHLVETNSLGRVNWYKRYADMTSGVFYNDMDLLPTGQIAVVGETAGSAATMVLFDSSAAMVYAYSYTPGINAYFRSIFHTNSLSYVMCGAEYIPAHAVVVETDYFGNVIRGNDYQVNNNPTNFIQGILLKNDNRLFVGQTYPASGNSTRTQLALLQTDGGGNVVWGLQTGDTSLSFSPQTAFELSDKSIVVAGTCTGGGPTYTSFPFLAKISSEGHSEWIRKIKSPDNFYMMDAIAMADDRIVLTGYNLPSSGFERAVICECDTAGHVVSTSLYHESLFGIDGMDLTTCTDGGVLMTGFTPQGTGYYYHYLLKTDNLLNASCNETPYTFMDSSFALYDSTGYSQFTSNVVTGVIPMSNFQFAQFTASELDACDPTAVQEKAPPVSELSVNVSQNTFILNFSELKSENEEVRIVDMIGRSVFQQTFFTNAGMNRLLIPLQDLEKGIYLVSLETTENHRSAKVLKD